MAAPTSGYTGSVFVPLPTNDELSLLRTLALKADKNLNVSRMIAGTDDMMVGAVAMVHAVFDAKHIPAQLREFIICVQRYYLIAPMNGSRMSRWQRTPAVRKLKLTLSPQMVR